MPSIYLASPLGFAHSTHGFMHDLTARLRQYVTVHNPWDPIGDIDPFEGIHAIDSVRERDRRLAEVNRFLGRNNREGIDASDGLFAILDGVDVDSGTAAEIGYAFGRGKYICGLRTDFRLAGDNPGSIVNLQVEYFIVESGGSIVTDVDAFVHLARDFGSRRRED
ncbi:MAG TPA: nucleoside 2-deoxyribosyltransferase [Thermomicrobiales bacterium]|nr:nucleoside 2-deoxyribosyltransferase [Thermomicrobiales bacterium]